MKKVLCTETLTWIRTSERVQNELVRYQRDKKMISTLRRMLGVEERLWVSVIAYTPLDNTAVACQHFQPSRTREARRSFVSLKELKGCGRIGMEKGSVNSVLLSLPVDTAWCREGKYVLQQEKEKQK